jgi:hypothetical protein
MRSVRLTGTFRIAIVAAALVGYAAVSGCSPEGTNSAPKLKGNKNEIQKELQSGSAKPGAAAKTRKS